MTAALENLNKSMQKDGISLSSNSYIAAIVEPSNRMQVMSALWRRLSWQFRITSHQQTINQITASVQIMIGAGIRTLKSHKATVLIYQSPCCRPSFQCTRGYPKMRSQNGALEYQHRMPMKVWTDWFGVDVLKCSTVVTRQCRLDKRLTAICKKKLDLVIQFDGFILTSAMSSLSYPPTFC